MAPQRPDQWCEASPLARLGPGAKSCTLSVPCAVIGSLVPGIIPCMLGLGPKCVAPLFLPRVSVLGPRTWHCALPALPGLPMGSEIWQQAAGSTASPLSNFQTFRDPQRLDDMGLADWFCPMGQGVEPHCFKTLSGNFHCVLLQKLWFIYRLWRK